MEATKAIASMPPGLCLGALEGCPLPRRKCIGALALQAYMYLYRPGNFIPNHKSLLQSKEIY